MADISIKVRGLDAVREFIDQLPRRVRGVATVAAAEYLVGNGMHGLRHYPAYKWITRKAAYGKTFVSDKQRRYVMAAIADGRIDPGAPHRTGRYQRGWMLEGEGAKTRIINEVDYARYVGGDEQARLNRKVGWRMWDEIISTNYHGAIQAAERAVDRLINGKGKA
jgi:hypothetical protein